MTSGDAHAGDDPGPPDDDASDDDARRWAQAEQRAAGVVVPDEGPMLRRFLLVELPIVLGGCLALAVVAALIWGDGRGWLGHAVSLTALFCMGGNLVRTMKQRPESSVSLAAILTPQDGRRNARQVMGREPVDVGHLPVLRLTARRLRRQAISAVLSFVGLELLCVGNAITSQRHLWFLGIFLVGMVGGGVLLVAAVRQIRRTSDFLRRYPDPARTSSEASSR